MPIDISTNRTVDIIDITDRIADSVPPDFTGVCTAFVRHTTAGITVNEHEARLVKDIEGLLGELVPDGGGYEHDEIDDNAAAHLRSILLGADLTVPVTDGELALGTWQSILLVESDGPRTRTVEVRTAARG